jgi:hypothetical protein
LTSPFLPSIPKPPPLSDLFKTGSEDPKVPPEFSTYEVAWRDLVQRRGDVINKNERWGSEWSFERKDRSALVNVEEEWGDVKYVELDKGGHDGVSLK